MDNQNESTTSPAQSTPTPADAKSQALNIPIGNTTALDCLEVMRHEYELERSIRQSFESRSNIIITVIAALCIFVFEKVRFSQILKLMTSDSLTFAQLLRILAGMGVYLGFVLTLFFVIRTVRVEKNSTLDVKQVNESLIGKPRLEGVIQFIITYREIILQHRGVNEQKAKALRNSMIWLLVSIISVVLYTNI